MHRFKMETLECIKSRRSVRKFLDKDLPDEAINKLIDAARYAPFGGKPTKECQPWEFIIIKDKEIKQKLALDFEDRQFITRAPVIIVVCADKTKDPKYKNWEITTSLAIQNLLLAVNDLKLGACYVTTFNHHEGHKGDREKLIQALNLPDHIELIAIIPIGYPDESENKEQKELREVNEMVHKDRWS